MRILMVVAELGTGGAETIVEDLALDRAARGDDVLVASAGGFRADRLRAQDVSTVHVPMSGRARSDLLQSARALRAAIALHRPQLVHVHNVKAAALVRAASLPRPRTALVTLHGVPDASFANAARVLRVAARHVVAVSHDVRERVLAAGLPATRVSVIDNAVSTPAPHDRIAARDAFDLPPDVPVAVCVARLVDQKRHDVLVSAWSSVPDGAVLLIVGDGPNRDRIAAQVEALGLQERVRLVGRRTDVDVLLAAADLSVLSSDWEGLPISVLEAMAAGVPVVATAVGELPVALAGAAELVAPGSPDALAVAITTVLTDPTRRAALVETAQHLIRTRYGVERMRAEYDAAYGRLLG